MPRGKLSEEDIKILIGNPNVLYVEGNRIIYSPVFKKQFVEEYQRGKKPGTIFKEAGFDTKMLGSKRIERASARWRGAYAASALSTFDDSYLRYKHKEEIEEDKLKQSERIVKKLEKEIKLLEAKLAEKDNEIIELRNRLRVYGEI